MADAGKALIDPQLIIKKMGLSEGMRVADMGCGRTGHFIFSMAKIVGETGAVYAVDIIKNVLESIRGRAESEGYANVRVVWSDIEKIGYTPIPENSLDVCLFVNVMFLLKDKAAALEEAKRLIFSQGLIVVVDWQKKLGPLGPTPELMLAPEKMRAIAAAAGLRALDEFPAGDYHYCLIFSKEGVK